MTTVSHPVAIRRAMQSPVGGVDVDFSNYQVLSSNQTNKVAGGGGEHGESREASPTTVFVSRNSSLHSDSGDPFANFSPYGNPDHSDSDFGGSGTVPNLMSTRSTSIDDLLRDSVESFHREGPLVNPLLTKHNQLTGESVKNMSMVSVPC